MNYQTLVWDTNFFGFKVAQIIDFIDENDFITSIKKLKEENYRLLYLFLDPTNTKKNEIISKYAPCIEKKITYHTVIEKKNYIIDNQIRLYDDKIVSSDLVKLSLQSGEYSRYKKDVNFPKGTYEKLYRQWIENSVNHLFDDAVYIYKSNEIIKGLLTLKDKQNNNGIVGTISLIAVDINSRGQNIGTKLIETTFFHYYHRNIFNIEVVTQLGNQIACKFYEKNNFKIKSIQNVYHIWI